jgi:hypothetical protein
MPVPANLLNSIQFFLKHSLVEKKVALPLYPEQTTEGGGLEVKSNTVEGVFSKVKAAISSNYQQDDFSDCILKWINDQENKKLNQVSVWSEGSLFRVFSIACLLHAYFTSEKVNKDIKPYIREILLSSIKKEDFIESRGSDSNFIFNLSKYLFSGEYSDLCNLYKSYRELPENTFFPEDKEKIKEQLQTLFRSDKNTYIDLMYSLLNKFEDEESNIFKEFFRTIYEESPGSTEILREDLLIMYQCGLFFQERSFILKKLKEKINRRKIFENEEQGIVFEERYFDRLGLDIKKESKEAKEDFKNFFVSGESPIVKFSNEKINKICEKAEQDIKTNTVISGDKKIILAKVVQEIVSVRSSAMWLGENEKDTVALFSGEVMNVPKETKKKKSKIITFAGDLSVAEEKPAKKDRKADVVFEYNGLASALAVDTGNGIMSFSTSAMIDEGYTEQKCRGSVNLPPPSEQTVYSNLRNDTFYTPPEEEQKKLRASLECYLDEFDKQVYPSRLKLGDFLLDGSSDLTDGKKELFREFLTYFGDSIAKLWHCLVELNEDAGLAASNDKLRSGIESVNTKNSGELYLFKKQLKQFILEALDCFFKNGTECKIISKSLNDAVSNFCKKSDQYKLTDEDKEWLRSFAQFTDKRLHEHLSEFLKRIAGGIAELKNHFYYHLIDQSLLERLKKGCFFGKKSLDKVIASIELSIKHEDSYELSKQYIQAWLSKKSWFVLFWYCGIVVCPWGDTRASLAEQMAHDIVTRHCLSKLESIQLQSQVEDKYIFNELAFDAKDKIVTDHVDRLKEHLIKQVGPIAKDVVLKGSVMLSNLESQVCNFKNYYSDCFDFNLQEHEDKCQQLIQKQAQHCPGIPGLFDLLTNTLQNFSRTEKEVSMNEVIDFSGDSTSAFFDLKNRESPLLESSDLSARISPSFSI